MEVRSSGWLVASKGAFVQTYTLIKSTYNKRAKFTRKHLYWSLTFNNTASVSEHMVGARIIHWHVNVELAIRCWKLVGRLRSSHWRCSVKKVFFKILLNSQKNFCARVSFNEAAALSYATLLKKRLWRRCFHVNFAKFLRTPSFQSTSKWRLL